jgi:hypothetical protein
MPQTHLTASATGLVPVPVAVFLPAPTGQHPASPVNQLPSWHGVTARDAASLVRRLSTAGDLVIELDRHPTITRAAEYLGRRVSAALPGVHIFGPPVPGQTVSTRSSHPAGLIFAALPRPAVPPGDLAGLSAAMRSWRTGLRPGGYLLTALTLSGLDHGGAEHPLNYRASVIAAARAARLTWQQEWLVLTAPPPSDDPRAVPSPPLDLPSALVDGRHRRVHRKLLAFRNNTGGRDA